MSTGLSLPALSLGMASYPMISGAARAVLYALIAAGLGTRLPGANWGLGLMSMLLGGISFVAVGIMAVGVVVVLRQAAGAIAWFLGAATLLAGVVFPVELLPTWLRIISGLSAATWTLRITRSAVLEGATWSSQWPSLLLLFAIGLGYTVVAVLVLNLGLRHARRSGGLAQY